MTSSKDSERIRNSALRPSIIESFSIDGLFGYRSISLNSKYAATVLIAKNGSGKTTLIGALDAFLRGQFTRLATLDFQSISCSIRGIHESMTISKEDVDSLMLLCNEVEFIARAKTWEVEPLSLLGLLENDLDSWTSSELVDDPTFHSIYMKISGYNINSAREQCKRIAESLKIRSPHLFHVRRLLRDALRGYEIVYLPTYRRIELSIPNPDSRTGRKKKSILARLGVSLKGLHTGDINFGLSDISDRLAVLYREIQFESNQGYGKVSANIIDDLITDSFENSTPETSQRPSKEALQIFFSRLKDSDRDHRYGPYNGLKIPDIEKIYNDDIPEHSKKFLNYFLGQLNSVMEKTKVIENTVAQFILNCNSYLSGDDTSTKVGSKPVASIEDDKVLNFNKRDLRVTVTSKITGKDIPLDALSSGEKQMISLFAQLYLYTKRKIVLIDEPELSLSINWQRKILPDILSSENCEQVIAITHSPFIFDNALEPFASSLRLSYSEPKDGELFPYSNPDDLGDIHQDYDV